MVSIYYSESESEMLHFLHIIGLVLTREKIGNKQECLSALCRSASICLYLISCVYLAYCRSYSHLKIVKCIGIY